jgi:regulator of replication initiation timing
MPGELIESAAPVASVPEVAAPAAGPSDSRVSLASLGTIIPHSPIYWPKHLKEPKDTPEFRASTLYAPISTAVKSIVTARDNAIVLLRDMAKKEAEFEKLARTIREKESEASAALDKLKELQQDNTELQEANSKLREQLKKKDPEALDKAAEAVEKFKGSQELRDLMNSRAALWAELTVRELRKAVIQNFGKCFHLVKEDFDFIRSSGIAEVVEKKLSRGWLRLLAKKDPVLRPDQVMGLQRATSLLSLRSKDVSEVKVFCKFTLGIL